MPGRVNYDALAGTYNRRFAGQSGGGILPALENLSRGFQVESVLEVGCGTGYWLDGLKSSAPLRVGLDFSAGMLAQAQQRGRELLLLQGRAEALPFPAGSFDRVYCVNAIHHFQGQNEFIRQARRVLRPGGALAVLGMDPHHNWNDWYVYEFFAGTYETDLARFPTWGQVQEWMKEAGFERIEFQLAEEIHEPKVGPAVLEDPFLAKNACSQLALLSDRAYADGLERIHRALAEAQAQAKALLFPNTIRIHMQVGWVNRSSV
jgi:SAM-dependent methyltransferase